VIDARHRNTALLVAGCFFMEMLDGTIVTTASPQIGRSLHAPATVGKREGSQDAWQCDGVQGGRRSDER
jgi:hypothetical protein